MSLIEATILLLLVMDPLGNIPVFISVLKNVPKGKRELIILRESLIAFLILITFLVAGEYILKSFHISNPALAIAGGIILFLISIKMVFPESQDFMSEAEEGDPFIFPLAMPLLAGPSSIALVMLLGTTEREHVWLLASAIILSASITTLILLISTRIQNLLGKRGLMATERLMGMILITLSVEMFLEGVTLYLKGLKI